MELRVAAVHPGLRVVTEARDLGEIEVEDELPPVHGVPEEPVSTRMGLTHESSQICFRRRAANFCDSIKSGEEGCGHEAHPSGMKREVEIIWNSGAG